MKYLVSLILLLLTSCASVEFYMPDTSQMRVAEGTYVYTKPIIFFAQKEPCHPNSPIGLTVIKPEAIYICINIDDPLAALAFFDEFGIHLATDIMGTPQPENHKKRLN